MFSFSGGNKQFNMNLRYKDFFIDFLACLIPGFLFLILSSTIIFSTIYLFFMFIPYNGANETFLSIDNLSKLKGIIYFPFWIHVSIFILSFMFGFFLYRQDPKKPDHVSYLKNRATVQGYNEWVISNNEGLHPKEVQFPYCNLLNYLKSRGFDFNNNVINWNCDKEKKEEGEEDLSQKHRSKAFVNKLKMRIGFFYPEALSTIIKNEAHIRFSSSMWYGFTVIIQLLYGAIFLFIIYENLILLKNSSNIFALLIIDTIGMLLVSISIILMRNKKNDYKIWDQDHKGDVNTIDRESLRLSKIYRAHDMFPFISSIVLTCTFYLAILLNTYNYVDNAYLLLLNTCLVSVISFFIFYAKQKIETSFHYQRVREIIYVVEIANLAKVLDNSDTEALLEKIPALSVG